MAEISVGIYHDRALQFANAMECHDDITAYCSAVALLAVHSAISYNDALLIKLTGKPSRSQDHGRAVVETKKACKKRNIRADGIRHLDKLVEAKTAIAYGDEAVDNEKIEFLYVAAARFQTWAERLLNLRVLCASVVNSAFHPRDPLK